MDSDSTQPTEVSLARGAGVGLVAGLGAGVIWWLVETGANWALGGVIPPRALAIMLGLDLALAGAAGLVAGALLALVARRLNLVLLALITTAAYGLIRIYEPPGWRAEALFVALAVAGVALGLRLAGPRHGWLAFLHVAFLTAFATGVGKAGLSKVQSSYFGHEEPSGVTLPLLLVGLPLAALVVDRIVAAMLRRHAVRFALEAAAVGLVALVWGQPLSSAPIDEALAASPPPAGAPDIVLISMDTTRADHMSTYGYERETSPRLTEFAADALNFTQARSPAQWTVPGHASMLTGTYPTRHGAHYAGGWHTGPLIYGRRRVFPLADDKTTLAEILHDHGYATGGFVANFANLFRGFGMAQGFQRYEDHPGLLLRPVPHGVRFLQRFAPTTFKKPFRSAQQLNAAALSWMDGVDETRPAFVFLNYLEPHHWLAAAPYDKWARTMERADELALKGLFTHAIPAGLSEEERAFVIANYDGQILAMDTAFGQLLTALKARGRYENALIIVTSDHGELLGEHDQVGHGGRMMYEGLLHVPLVVKLPGENRPRGVIEQPVQLVDIVPTVLETLGLPVPAGVQGEPLQQVTRASLAEEHINPEFVAYYGNVYNRAMRVWYDWPYKLITTSRGERFLYDLSRDRDEEENLAAREPARVAAMEQQLEAAMGRMSPAVATGPRVEMP